MRIRFINLILFLLLPGCGVLYPPLKPESTYFLSRPRAEIIGQLGKPYSTWDRESGLETRSCDIQKAIERFGAKNKKLPYTVDVFWIMRTPLGGLYWDYVFYDENDLVLGYIRRFLD